MTPKTASGINDTLRATLLLLGVALLVLLREVVAVVFLGILLGTLLSFPVTFLARRVPRGLAVILVLLGLGGALSGIGVLAYQPLANQMAELKTRIPDALKRAEGWIRKTERENKVMGPATEGRREDYFGPFATRAARAAGGLLSIFSAAIIVVVLAAFFAHAPGSYQEAARALIPRDHEWEFDELWRRLSRGLRHWVGGILVSMVIMGSLTAIGLGIAGIQGWPLLGLITFFGTFVPYVGAICSAIPGLALALSQSSEKFVLAIGIYLAIHVIEGYLVEPLIMKRAVIVRPAVLISWQLAMATALGIYGIVIATPLLVCFKIIGGFLYVEKRLGKKAAAA